MGIGDWGLGIGDWGLGPIPNPHEIYIIILIFIYNYYLSLNNKINFILHK